MTISRTFRYDIFNPNTNTFDYDHRQFSKEVDKETERAYNAAHNLKHLCAILIPLLFIGTIVFGAISENPSCSVWSILACITCLVLTGVCVYLALSFECKEDNLIEDFRKTAFKQEEAEMVEYNSYQMHIAEEWRKEHPFEEKIRMAQTRGSSVDIAEMVRYYAEYINNGKEEQ